MAFEFETIGSKQSDFYAEYWHKVGRTRGQAVTA